MALPVESCGGFGQPETPSDLLRGRLSIRVPVGGEAVPNQPHGIMGPADGDESRSELNVTRDGVRLRIIAAELFARRGSLSDSELSASISQFIGMKADEVAPVELAAATPLKLVAVEPRTPRAIRNATTRFASIVEDADGFLLFVGISLDGESASGAGCSAEVRAIARTLSLGKRRLAASEGWRSLGTIPTLGEIEVHLPEGWLVRKSVGPDFEVWHLTLAGKLGKQPPMIGIYSGGHPSFQPTGSPSKTGVVLGKPARWYEHTEDGETQPNALVEVSDDNYLHVWIAAGQPDNSSVLREIVETLRTVKTKTTKDHE
jgi:hypothetical protein